MREFRVCVAGMTIGEKLKGENLRKGTTSKLRKSITNRLARLAPELEKHDIRLVVSDHGEIIDDTLTSRNKTKAIKRDLTRKVRELKDAHDLVLIVGGRHEAAYSLYQFPGQVARADFHSDTGGMGDEKLGDEEMHWGNYIRHVIAVDGLKRRSQIENYGMMQKDTTQIRRKGRQPLSLEVPTFRKEIQDIHKTRAKVYDIDSDGLLDVYGAQPTEFPPNPKGVAASSLGKAFIKNGPEVVGFFEYYEEDEHAPRLKKLITALYAVAVKGAAARKYHIKIPEPHFKEAQP
jgi:hypothetical protein